MENAVDALKMAAAIMIFIIAFSVTIMLFSQARQSTDAVLNNLRLKDFFPQVESLEADGTTRMVGIETIIPTLYRYCQSDTNLRVVIKNSDGKELQVFDTAIEAIIHEGKSSNDSDEKNALYEKYNKKGLDTYMFEAPWEGQNQEYYRVERVNAYINGTTAKHMPQVDYTHNNLMSFSDWLFKESYIEYMTSGEVVKDDYGEEIVKIQPMTKIIVIYQAFKKV